MASDPLAKALATIAVLEADLKASQQEAHLANQELQHFVYAASHDLEEPLRAIKAYAQLLERLHPDDVQAREYVCFITAGTAAMKRLIENLLLYSRIKLSPPLRSVKLDAVVQTTLFKLSAQVKESGAVVRFAQLPEIIAFEAQICQLLEQILSNAILYRGTRPPEIQISAEEGEWNGDAAQILCVKDNGVGIEPQYFQQVLLPFKRLHGKDYPGNGLGLAICEKIMRANKGKLWIDSDGKSWTAVYMAFRI